MEKKIVIIIGVVLAVLIIWGLIGAQEAAKLTNTCKVGLGDRLCWIWEKNTLGEIADLFKK